jgi:CBS-domain-containing membrane protein
LDVPPAVASAVWSSWKRLRWPRKWIVMIGRRVRNVMTREVITVDEEVPFTEMVRRMTVHKVSALPVVDSDGMVVGVVSEADLLDKEEYQDEEEGRTTSKGAATARRARSPWGAEPRR